MFVLTIALLGLASVTTMVIKGNSFSKTMTTGTALAKDKMEQLKRTGYLSDSGTYTDTPKSGYTRTWKITDNDPATGMKTFEVTVDRPGIGDDIILKTIVIE